MDRRQRRGITGGLTGTLAGRPSPGVAGRVYLVNPAITVATSVGGTTQPLPQIDTGTRWITPRSVTYFNGALTFSATVAANTQRKAINGVLPGGILGVGNRAWIMVSTETRNLATAGGTLTQTWRLKYGTATIVKLAVSLATAAANQPSSKDYVLYLENINGVTNAQAGALWKADQSAANMTGTLTTGTPAIDSTVSQVFDCTVSFDRQVAGATKAYVKIRYVSVAVE